MKLLCIDSNSILNRAFYGIKLLSTKDGVYTNAIFGYMNIFKKLCDEVSPDAVACAFDLRAPTFRHKMYDGYKATRKGMPDELAGQLPLVQELLGLLGYRIVTAEGYEADDILGTFARACTQSGDTCVIATGDRDSLQLVSDETTVLLASTKMGKPATTVCTPDYIRQTYGVSPAQLIDVKALMGDASDNIPGVAGIGEKGALKLITEHGSLDAVYASLETLPVSPKLREKLAAGRESAMLSRKLAEICCTAPIDTDPASYVRAAPDYAGARALLARLQMFSLIDRLELPAADAAPPADTPDAAQTAAAEKPLLDCSEIVVEALLHSGVPIRMLCSFQGDDAASFALDAPEGVYYCAADSLPFQGMLKSLLESGNEKWVDGVKPLHRYAIKHGIRVRGITFDVGLAGYLLSPNSTEYTIDKLLAEYGIRPAAVTMMPPDYADAPLITACAQMEPLCERLHSEINESGLGDILQQVELPLARVLASMELTGFMVDAQGIADFGRELDGSIRELEDGIYRMAGGSFNINSPKQLGEILFDRLGLPSRRKNKSGYSTDAKVLESLQEYHPIVAAILEYRQLAKLRSTYVDGLIKAVGADGRIHSVFKQMETRTGRISSTEPNMQNIPVRTPLGSRMRKYFVAAPGCVLVDADYSQIELRVLAHIAQDGNMQKAFSSGEDIHTQTAAQVFDLPPELVTPELRSRAKAVNFGIVYGIGAFSLSKDIGVSIKEADQYIKNYLDTFSGVKHYMERTVEQAKKDGYVSTIMGRRRYLPELNSTNKNIQAFGKRVAMNMPIQGTAADIIKLAMIRVFERLEREGLQTRLILQVHDELIVEAPQEEAARAADILREEMENAVSLKVRMKVDLNQGENWYDAK